jgi:hypothetical protein
MRTGTYMIDMVGCVLFLLLSSQDFFWSC